MILADPAPQCPQQLPRATVVGTRNANDTLICAGGQLQPGQTFTVDLSTNPPPVIGMGGDLFGAQNGSVAGPFPIYGPSAPPPNDFSLSVSPASGQAAPGGSVAATVSTGVASGAAQSVSLSASGLPAGSTASFSPQTVTAGDSSTLTITTAAATPPGTYPITITGVDASATHSTTFALTVASAPAPSTLSLSCNLAPGSNDHEIDCMGSLMSGGSGVPQAPITLTYQPPSGSPTTHTASTTSNGTFADNYSVPLSGPPLAPGAWAVQARFAGDSTHAAASDSQSVIVP
jgi:hypothetical protein